MSSDDRSVPAQHDREHDQGHQTGPSDEQAATDSSDTEARLDVIEAKFDWLENHVIPRVDDLEDRVDGHDDLENEVASLRAELETLHAVDENAASTPAKRRTALQKAMLNQHEARTEAISLDYNEVSDILEQRGHGKIYPAQAYTAMEDAAETPGFVDSEIAKNGDTVRGVKLVPDELPPSLAAEDAVNEINNESSSVTVAEAGETSTDTRT